MFEQVIIRYGEISNKGGNRSSFERLLVKNIQKALIKWPEIRVSRISGRIVVALQGAPYVEVKPYLERIFGIHSFSPVLACSLHMTEIEQSVLKFLDDFAIHHPQAQTFKLEIRRANKQFPMQTLEIARELGGKVLEAGSRWQVDVHHPDVTVRVEIREEKAFIYGEIVPAPSGLPLGMSGRSSLLLSGGIDSPVAGWRAMKRGLYVDGVHFQSYPFTSERALQKVESLAQLLADWAGQFTLYEVSLTDIQSEIRKHCREEMRTILMRRMMVRIANILAEKAGSLALIMGDSLGQVASQTLEGLHVLDEVSNLPILRPLITEDKVDIIHQARVIGTYETSILPYEDCCSIFAPKSPKTRPTRHQAAEEESNLQIDEMIQMAVEETVEKTFYADWRSENASNRTS